MQLKVSLQNEDSLIILLLDELVHGASRLSQDPLVTTLYERLDNSTIIIYDQDIADRTRNSSHSHLEMITEDNVTKLQHSVYSILNGDMKV